MNQDHRAGGMRAWWIRGPAARWFGSSSDDVTLLAAPAVGAMTKLTGASLGAAALIAAGCGPTSLPGREGFTDTTFSDTGTETFVEPDLPEETDTETGEPECPELINTGNVSIGSPDELYELDGVTKIDGDVEIIGQWGLLEDGLDPLRCLEEITGFFYVHDTDLQTFEGLERLRRIGGYFYVGQTLNLESLYGLSSLRQIGSYLHLTENFGMISTLGTDLLVDVGEFVIVDNNPFLQDLAGFSSLPGTNGQLRIQANNSLTTLYGLHNIIGVRGNLGVLDNPSLSDTSALAGIQRVGGDVLWQNNPAVFSLDLWALQTIDGFLFIVDMPSVQNLDDLFGLIGINTHLFIWNTGLANIDGLLDLQFLGGDIWIQDNANLSNIDGLLSLQESFGLVRIDQNPGLVDASGLDNLQTISGGLSLWGNANLSNMSLGSLDSVGEFLRIGFSSLGSIPPTPVHTIGEDLLIFNNDGLVDVSGFAALETIGGRLYMRENPALQTMDFPALTQVFDRVQFIDNDALNSLVGLSNVQLAQAVNIRENDALVNVSGLSGLTQVPGMFKIVDNGILLNLTGINALTQVGGELDIRDNPNLQNILGLQGLDVVGSNVTISGNTTLPTCTAQGLVDQLSFIGGATDVSGNLADACGG